MKQINDPAQLATALNNSEFNSHFSFDIGQYSRLYRANAGDYILREGCTTDKLYYMLSGSARLRKSMPNGKATLLDFPSAPCFLGEMELLGVRSETLEVRATEQCLIIGVAVEECRELLLSDCVFLRFLCVYLGNKERRETQAISRMQSYPLANRLALFILEASVDGIYGERNTDAAEYLGVSYRHLQQVLKEFTEKGYIRKQNGGREIRNENALRELAAEMSGS